MKKQSAIWMSLRPQTDLKVFVLETGMDIFVPVFIWPKHIPSIEVHQNMMTTDMRVTKNVFIKNQENCETKENYRYAGI